MPGTNQFLPFAVGAGANTLTPTAYAALTTLLAGGFQAGVAPSAQFNTALRQATTGVAGLAKFISDHGANALDDGNHSNFADALLAALVDLFTSSTALFGPGQNWQTVTRAADTTYYNTTGRLIVLNAYTGHGTAGNVTNCVINGFPVPGSGDFTTTGYTGYSWIIPAGASYRLSASSGTLNIVSTQEFR